MIQVRGLTKDFGRVRAVDGLTFDVEPGTVTGFLGPNGAGKSTTMRMLLGLDRPTAGTATVGGRRYVELPAPMREVGALLDAAAMHPGRSGRTHLRIAARSNGIPMTRVDEVVERVGLGAAARRRIKGYSLGMRQRLGIATALLGDPPVLVFDEPVNGLDLEGVRWIRTLFRDCADEGRTVFVSSHLMSEVQLVADRVVIIGRGRLVADARVDEVLARGRHRVRVRSPRADELAAVIGGLADVVVSGVGELEVVGLNEAEVGDTAHRAGVPLHHLATVEESLEAAYWSLTQDEVEFRGSASDRAGEAS
ncbi:ABC transporter ATP-binding protein [Phycicoccus sp. CSK15P-2]|uniref:ABC transporter ATP-binding protein n=1 Tax=Phycicoccus sp. CSK15P-2 TaxID=2807627 RepID=UPI0019509FD5|nr:ABC transporter ATP-binding protein [Phycicoccus sp. CSK15P-2]MBM6404168.1 ABC transporter ATP-binding protein [Phycicoccus sp. CSK15P-2]